MTEEKIKPDSKGEVIKFEQEGMPLLEVLLEDETIWLTQKQMGELFGCAPQNITYHLKGIFKSANWMRRQLVKHFYKFKAKEGVRLRAAKNSTTLMP